MGEPLKLDNSISGDQLHNAFPFIHRNGWKPSAKSRSAQQAVEYHPEAALSFRMPFQQFPAKVFDDLTKKEMQCALEVLHYAMRATSGADVHQLLQLIKGAVACSRVIGGIAQLNSHGTFEEFNSVINVSYSNEWLYTYCKRKYAGSDVVLQSILSTFQTQVWEQTYKKTASPKELEFVEEARGYDLTHGVTTGMLEPGRNFASFFSFAGGDFDNTVRYKGLLEYLLPYLHRIMLMNLNTPSVNRMKGLSPRELMVLEWMKQGKTNWEISRIIGVSERTVRFHVESIFAKLDVGSRTQAVACAIEQGLFPST